MWQSWNQDRREGIYVGGMQWLEQMWAGLAAVLEAAGASPVLENRTLIISCSGLSETDP
jgi:hypothetical protein